MVRVSLVVLWLASGILSAQQDATTVSEQHLMVPMRDGKKLSTYVYLPPGKGPWPVLYEQRYSDITVPSSRKNYSALAMKGYVIAAQNFRGTHLSEGTYVGYRALGFGRASGWLRFGDVAQQAALVKWQDRDFRRLAGRICAKLSGSHAAPAAGSSVHDRYRSEPLPLGLSQRRNHQENELSGCQRSPGRTQPDP